MLIDASSLDSDAEPTADVAIAGGGLAGLILAKQLALAGRRVIVLESGGLEPCAAGDALNRGSARIADGFGSELAFDDYLLESRCRCLGGSGVLWGGKCAELDPIDFEQRKWIEHSGWPLGYDELKPYLNRACHALELPAFQRNAPLDPADARPPLIIAREQSITTGLRRYSAIAGRVPANRFQQFLQSVTSLERVTVYLNATVVAIPAGADRVERFEVCAPGTRFTVVADRFVLASGGLENPRLLLAMGHGRQHDSIGRYFMGHVIHRRTHPDLESNQMLLGVSRDRLALYLDKDPTQLQGVLQLSRNAQKRERLPNCSLTLETTEAGDEVGVYFMLEQRPQPQSRITLRDDCDAHGVPRLHLEWRFQESDFADLGRILRLFEAELAQHSIGRLQYQFEPQAMLRFMSTARHHMGATRMHADPELGAVDEDCRVHGLANLYVAGASLFTTSGISNPTLTIIALALRLADHLALPAHQTG